MKKYLLLSAAMIAMSGVALADGYDLTVKNISEFSTSTSTPATGDLYLIWDASANTFVKQSAIDLKMEDLAVADSLSAEDLTVTRAPSADSAATNTGADVNLTSPVDTTGTNLHNALNVDLTVGNATGGTNSLRGLRVGNVTGDAQVNVQGVSVGTGTVLGTSFGLFIDSGWDSAAELNVAAAADSAQTNLGLDVDLVTPVDTTGTNSHYGMNIDTTIGNASGGTNTAIGLNVAAVTGDAQVNVTGINLAGGTVLGTSDGIVVAAGWDKAVNLTSAATADSGATDMGIDLNLTTPVDTTGTNIHYGLNIDTTIGNATAGTNTATAINIANVTGDAQVTETGINVGTGFDTGAIFSSPASFASTIIIDSTTVAENLLKYAGRGTFTVCGDIATVNNNTVYYGPSQAVVDSATAGMVTCNTDASGNTTEATASEPAIAGRAIVPLGMVCYSTDMGATGSPLTYTLRAADAAYDAGAITTSIADNVLSGASPVNTIGTTEIAANAAVAVALSSGADVGAGAFICQVSYAF